MTKHRLVCIDCGEEYSGSEPRYLCDCGSLLEVRYNSSPSRIDFSGDLGVWRYGSTLPVDSVDSTPISIQEGGTPLYDAVSLSESIGVDLHVKHEGMNPTGSFKDRGMTVGVTKAIELGIERVACASTGNTSAALAAYSAASRSSDVNSGVRGVVLLPEGKVALGKIAQALMHGADVLEIDGNFDDCLSMVRELGDEGFFYVLNSINPYRLEGQKTIAFEILDQLDWDVPDRVVLPVGNAGNISAVYKGFRELCNGGVIEDIPAMTGVQAEGASPFASAVKKASDLEPFDEPETKATAIRIGNPVNAPKAREAIEETGGTATSVSDDEITRYQSRLAREEGIGVEPASATSVAGTQKLVDEGEIDEGETVVCVVTGHLLKDPDAAIDASSKPVAVGGSVEDVREYLS